LTPFWLKHLVRLFVLPPGGTLVIIVAGLALAGRYPRRGRQLALAGVIALFLLSMPIVGELLVGSLDGSPALDLTHASGAQAIVILGGGTRVYAPEYRGATLSALSLERVRYGARIARATALPVLVSGGAVRGAPPEAVLMRNALVNEFGVPVRWLETRSRNTHENALRSAEILRANGVARVILVGHSFDFPRSRAEFEAAGIAVIPAPISLAATWPGSIGDFVPSAAGLQRSYYACYEALANAWYWMGRSGSGGGSGHASGEASAALRGTR
jgi:uncharacterized SAM-binding protein YcdF (DUF218 family)